MVLVSHVMISRLCFATPIAGGRILETGVENLLKLKQEGYLGTGMDSLLFHRIYKPILSTLHSAYHHRIDKVR
jgi:hypothetical protein